MIPPVPTIISGHCFLQISENQHEGVGSAVGFPYLFVAFQPSAKALSSCSQLTNAAVNVNVTRVAANKVKAVGGVEEVIRHKL